jgi:peptide/nickel transport system substrate-binding protein
VALARQLFSMHEAPAGRRPAGADERSPDLAKAVRLAKESGTTGVRVTVWTFNDGPGKAVGAYLVRLLQQLGYRAKLHAVLNAYAPFGTRRTIQMGATGAWIADFPRPSAFFSRY